MRIFDQVRSLKPEEIDAFQESFENRLPNPIINWMKLSLLRIYYEKEVEMGKALPDHIDEMNLEELKAAMLKLQIYMEIISGRLQEEGMRKKRLHDRLIAARIALKLVKHRINELSPFPHALLVKIKENLNSDDPEQSLLIEEIDRYISTRYHSKQLKGIFS